MVDAEVTAQDLPAGDFSAWLGQIQGALRGERASEVPCNGCTACCRSSQFVDVGPDEVDTLAHIPGQLLFPAPGRPVGHLVMGYDERGHCPMLVDEQCSIYEHRPVACRTYDCRIFPATGVDVGDDGKPLIAARARRWRFEYPRADDRILHDAVRAAATFVRQHQGLLPADAAPANQTQLAVRAIEVHDAFLGHDDHTQRPMVVHPDADDVQAVVIRRRGPRRVG